MDYFLYFTNTFFTHENELIGINFCKINCNLGLYTQISRIYPYTVNVYKNFVQAMFERLKKNSYVRIFISQQKKYTYVCVCVCVSVHKEETMAY